MTRFGTVISAITLLLFMGDSTTSIPPRFRWLKRLGLLTLVLILLLVGLRFYWGHIWSSQFEDQLQAIRDRGEPIDVADFNPPPPPENENGAMYLRQAMQTWPTIPGDSRRITDHPWYDEWPSVSADPITDHAAYLNDVEAILKLIDRADQTEAFDWGIPTASPVINNLIPQLGELRGLGRLMEDAAERAMDAGRPALALNLMRSIDVLAESCQSPPVSLIEHLVGTSLRALAIGMVETHLPRLNRKQVDETITAELVRLLEKLSDEEGYQRANQYAYFYERMFVQDTVTALLDGRLTINSVFGGGGSPTWLQTCQRWLIKPLYLRDGCLMMDYHTQFASAAADGSPAAFDRVNTEFAYLENEWWQHPLAGLLLPALGAAQRTHFQSVMQQRLARTAVALKLYELEHGHVAAALAELVPEFLPAVPRNLMDPEGGPLRYQPGGAALEFVENHWLTDEQVRAINARPLPILYGVGDNGADDGGVVVIDEDGSPQDISRYRSEGDVGPTDHWFLLGEPLEAVPDPNPNVNPYGYGGGYGAPGGGYGSP